LLFPQQWKRVKPRRALAAPKTMEWDVTERVETEEKAAFIAVFKKPLPDADQRLESLMRSNLQEVQAGFPLGEASHRHSHWSNSSFEQIVSTEKQECEQG
jgi:hypothetical protein